MYACFVCRNANCCCCFLIQLCSRIAEWSIWNCTYFPTIAPSFLSLIFIFSFFCCCSCLFCLGHYEDDRIPLIVCCSQFCFSLQRVRPRNELNIYRRKKKCIRYMENDGCNDERTNDNDDMRNMSDDNLGSCGSVDDVKTPPEDDIESLNLSSPGAFNGLPYLQSPPANLASPMRTHLYHKTSSSFINSNKLYHMASHINRINNINSLNDNFNNNHNNNISRSSVA